jgi:voltage-gated potassium channel
MLHQRYSIHSARQKRFEKVNQYIRKIVLAISLLFIFTIVGILGFMLIEDYPFWDAFYMTIITLSTVGFGETHPLSQEGRIFTSFLIIFNLGLFAYAITIISNFFVEGELHSFLKDYTMYKKIQELEQHTIICGYGRHGHQICEELIKNKLPFVVIEPDASLFEDLRGKQHFFLEGDASNDEVLIEAGILKAKAIAITYSENAFNVYTVLTARQLNPNIRIITRASDHKAEQKLLRAGANNVVLSEAIGGFYMATLIHQPNAVEFLNIISNMGDVAIHFLEVAYDEVKKEHQDKAISDLDWRLNSGVNIIGAHYSDRHYDINPKPNVYFQKGMKLVVLGDLKQIEAFKGKVLLI